MFPDSAVLVVRGAELLLGWVEGHDVRKAAHIRVGIPKHFLATSVDFTAELKLHVALLLLQEAVRHRCQTCQGLKLKERLRKMWAKIERKRTD